MGITIPQDCRTPDVIAQEGKDFIFKSLITCGTTGRTVSSDRKENRTNKNTYLITRDPQKPKQKGIRKRK